LLILVRHETRFVAGWITHASCNREDHRKADILRKSPRRALQATNCQTGAMLAREQAEAEDKEHVLKAVAKAGTRMRAKLGESLSSVEKLNRPSASEVTTTSLEALKAYQLGYDLLIQR
jgi:hypothetical protein